MPLVLLLMVLQYEPLTLKQYDVTAVDITEIEDAVLTTLRDTTTLEEVAKQSYLHQNGFCLFGRELPSKSPPWVMGG